MYTLYTLCIIRKIIFKPTVTTMTVRKLEIVLVKFNVVAQNLHLRNELDIYGTGNFPCAWKNFLGPLT
jgi:hypothetical protein